MNENYEIKTSRYNTSKGDMKKPLQNPKSNTIFIIEIKYALKRNKLQTQHG